MALAENVVTLLLAAKRDGVNFGSTLTLGRHWFKLDRFQLARINREVGAGFSEEQLEGCMQVYADGFFRMLGATEIHSLDASDFEGASIVHDLNTPIDERWHARFDVVLDSGTLEHVFNFPVALKSAMQAVKPGGTLFIATPTNNNMGHGFYQFGPEVFFRALSEENGFELRRVIIFEKWHPRWYSVNDPKALGKRVKADGVSPAGLLVQAVRKEVKPIFQSWPQQSDYSSAWQEGQFGKAPKNPNHRPLTEGGGRLWNAAPHPVRTTIASLYSWLQAHTLKRSRTVHNRRLFTPVDP